MRNLGNNWPFSWVMFDLNLCHQFKSENPGFLATKSTAFGSQSSNHIIILFSEFGGPGADIIRGGDNRQKCRPEIEAKGSPEENICLSCSQARWGTKKALKTQSPSSSWESSKCLFYVLPSISVSEWSRCRGPTMPTVTGCTRWPTWARCGTPSTSCTPGWTPRPTLTRGETRLRPGVATTSREGDIGFIWKLSTTPDINLDPEVRFPFAPLYLNTSLNYSESYFFKNFRFHLPLTSLQDSKIKAAIPIFPSRACREIPVSNVDCPLMLQ